MHFDAKAGEHKILFPVGAVLIDFLGRSWPVPPSGPTNMGPKWARNGPEMGPKWARNGPEMGPKWVAARLWSVPGLSPRMSIRTAPPGKRSSC